MVPSIHYSLRRLSFSERGGTWWGWGHWWEEIECIPVAACAVPHGRASQPLQARNGPGRSSTSVASAALGQEWVSWNFLTSSCFTLKIFVSRRVERDFGGNFCWVSYTTLYWGAWFLPFRPSFVDHCPPRTVGKETGCQEYWVRKLLYSVLNVVDHWPRNHCLASRGEK